MTKEEIREAFRKEQEEKRQREKTKEKMASVEADLIAQANDIYKDMFKLRAVPERNDIINIGGYLNFIDGLPEEANSYNNVGLIYEPALKKVTVSVSLPSISGEVMIEIERPTSWPTIAISGYSVEPMVVYHVWLERKSDTAVFVQPLIVKDDNTAWLADMLIVNMSRLGRVKWYYTVTNAFPKLLNMLNSEIQWLMYNRPAVMVSKSVEHKFKPSHSASVEDYRKVWVQSVYSVDFTKSLESPGHDSSRKFSCPCWGVAGHIRHYKNGKEVWIKPYRKGVDRDKPETYSPKEYVLMS